MFTARKTLQLQWIMLLGGVGLSAYFGLVYLPLREKAESLDTPLRRARQLLITINKESPFVGGLEPERIEETLTQMRTDLDALKRAEASIFASLELDAATRTRLRAPFQLVDYQSERQLRLEEFSALAKKQNVALEPAVAAGFPEYVADRSDPALLWAQLNLVNHLLNVAAQAKVTSIVSLQTPVPEPQRLAEGGGIYLDIVPIRLELTGQADTLARFLRTIPLRTEEAKALGLPEPLPGKPAMFIDKLVLRKIAPDKVDQGHLEVLVRGLVYRE